MSPLNNRAAIAYLFETLLKRLYLFQVESRQKRKLHLMQIIKIKVSTILTEAMLNQINNQVDSFIDHFILGSYDMIYWKDELLSGDFFMT